LTKILATHTFKVPIGFISCDYMALLTIICINVLYIYIQLNVYKYWYILQQQNSYGNTIVVVYNINGNTFLKLSCTFIHIL